MKNKRKRIILSSIITLILVLMVGATYAIFNYSRLGENGQVVLGEIYMKSTSKTGEVVINDMLPSSTYDLNNYYEFQITGKNTYTEKDIYYEIVLSYGNDSKTRSERIKDEFLKFRLVEVENGQEIELINNRSYMDLENKRIYVNTIKKNTISEINKTYRLYVWVSDEILIGNVSEADYDIDTWNNEIYANLNVTVNGDLYDKYIPNSQLAHINTTYALFWPTEIENLKTSITEVNFVNLDLEEMNNIKSTNTYLEQSILNNKIYDLEQTNAIGFVKSFLVEDTSNLGTYKMYVASEDDNLYFPSDSSYMFNGFTNIKNINYQNIVLNTSLVTDMRHIFDNCNNLESLDISSFDTSNVTAMHYMFNNCNKLTELDVSSFNTSLVTRMEYMFSGCSSLTSLDVSNFNTSNVTRMENMFGDCDSITELNLQNFDTQNVTNMYAMFKSMDLIKNLNLSNFNTSKVTSMGYMFDGCINLENLNVTSFDTSNVTAMHYMFSNCNKLTELDVSDFDTSQVTRMEYMFNICSSLLSLDLSNFDTSKVTKMASMFADCKNLTSLDVSSFNTSLVSDMGGMFWECDGLTSLDISSFDTSNVIYMNHMFFSVSKITTIYVSDKWTVDNVTTSTLMFEGDSKLVGGNGTKYSGSYIDSTYARIDTAETPGYFTYKEYVPKS